MRDILHTGCTSLTSLPDNLTVWGGLDLVGCTGLTSLPDNLTVGGYLDLTGCTSLTSLPDNLTVGGSIYLRGTAIAESSNISRTLSAESRQRINALCNRPIFWHRGGKTYIKADGMFTEVVSHRGNVYLVRQPASGKHFYLVTDGENHWAHGDTLQEARADLIFKVSDRDTTAYKDLSLDDTLSFEEAIAAYRTITGACSTGTRDYVINRLPKPHKQRYTIREIIDLTEGEYKSSKFKDFFIMKFK